MTLGYLLKYTQCTKLYPLPPGFRSNFFDRRCAKKSFLCLLRRVHTCVLLAVGLWAPQIVVRLRANHRISYLTYGQVELVTWCQKSYLRQRVACIKMLVTTPVCESKGFMDLVSQQRFLFRE